MIKRRDFLRRSLVVGIGALIGPIEAFGQAVPFAYWAAAAATGILRTTQMNLLVASFSGPNAPMNVTQANFLVSTSGSTLMRTTQVNLLASTFSASGTMQITQLNLVTSASASSTGAFQTTQTLMLVAAKP